jgi:repressor LexA
LNTIVFNNLDRHFNPDPTMQTATPLTDSAVLAFLQETHRRQRRMPSIHEVATHFNHRSPTSVQRCFARLVEEGLLEKHGRQYGLATSATRKPGLAVLGTIAAGQPIEAIEQTEPEERIELGAYDPDQHFGLKVKGDSMIEALIGDGDIAIIRRQETCHDGEIVAAVIDGEATLKRFFKKKDHMLLKPENARFKPLKVKSVEIRGVLVGVLRRYSR